MMIDQSESGAVAMTESLWGQYQRAVSRWAEDQSEANRLALVAAYGGWVRSFCPSYVDEPEPADLTGIR
jgi:hypothetical protein